MRYPWPRLLRGLHTKLGLRNSQMGRSSGEVPKVKLFTKLRMRPSYMGASESGDPKYRGALDMGHAL